MLRECGASAHRGPAPGECPHSAVLRCAHPVRSPACVCVQGASGFSWGPNVTHPLPAFPQLRRLAQASREQSERPRKASTEQSARSGRTSQAPGRSRAPNQSPASPRGETQLISPHLGHLGGLRSCPLFCAQWSEETVLLLESSGGTWEIFLSAVQVGPHFSPQPSCKSQKKEGLLD